MPKIKMSKWRTPWLKKYVSVFSIRDIPGNDMFSITFTAIGYSLLWEGIMTYLDVIIEKPVIAISGYYQSVSVESHTFQRGQISPQVDVDLCYQTTNRRQTKLETRQRSLCQ